MASAWRHRDAHRDVLRVQLHRWLAVTGRVRVADIQVGFGDAFRCDVPRVVRLRGDVPRANASRDRDHSCSGPRPSRARLISPSSIERQLAVRREHGVFRPPPICFERVRLLHDGHVGTDADADVASIHHAVAAAVRRRFGSTSPQRVAKDLDLSLPRSIHERANRLSLAAPLEQFTMWRHHLVQASHSRVAVATLRSNPSLCRNEHRWVRDRRSTTLPTRATTASPRERLHRHRSLRATSTRSAITICTIKEHSTE